MKRLLELARAWPDSLSAAAPRQTTSARTVRQLRHAEIDELVAAYRAGGTVYQLAEQFGVNRVTVGKHLRKRGIETTPPGLHPGDVPAAAELYRSGWSLERIANKFSSSAGTIRTRLLEAGVQMRPQQGGRQATAHRTE